MQDKHKSKTMLIEELADLHKSVKRLEESEEKRKRAEDALIEEKAFTKATLDTLTDLLLVFDFEDGFVRWNKRVVDVTGYTDDEIPSIFPTEFVTGDDCERVATAMENAVRSGHDSIEVCVYTKDGMYIPYEISGDVLVDHEGNPKCICVIGRDITERKNAEEALSTANEQLEERVRERTSKLVSANEQLRREITERKRAEEALRESEEKYRMVVERANDGIAIIQDRRLKFINNRTTEMVGYTVDELIDTPFINYLPSGEVLKALDRYKRRMAGEDVTPSFDSVLRKRDGTTIDVEINAGFMSYEGQTSELLVIRDITERRKLQEERAKVENLESLGVLAGGLAHDFNNILTTVMGNVSFAKMDMDRDSETYEALQEAEKASHRAKNLTQQLLTFAKGGALVKETASLSKVIRESGSFVLKGSNVRCDFAIPEDIWPTEIDVGQISQVTQNLIINADQSMPDGGVIKIEIENRVIGAEDALPLPSGKYVHVSVRDKGIGIPEKHLPKIFDPYFSTKDKGSGLGLATAHSIIKKHGGHITVDSELGAGTLFHFHLPASEREMGEAKALEREFIKGDGRVLVMDDEESLRNLAHQVLGRMGYHVESAKDGEEAIAKYVKAMKEGKPFDAVILDLTIPGGMGGKEAISKLKEIDPKVKAIVASGYSDDPVLANFRDYGFIGVVSKPFNLNKLSWVLHDVLTANDK